MSTTTGVIYPALAVKTPYVPAPPARGYLIPDVVALLVNRKYVPLTGKPSTLPYPGNLPVQRTYVPQFNAFVAPLAPLPKVLSTLQPGQYGAAALPQVGTPQARSEIAYNASRNPNTLPPYRPIKLYPNVLTVANNNPPPFAPAH